MTTPAQNTIGVGVKMTDAVRQTGLTVWQLRKLIRDGAVRHDKPGHFIEIHPDDVAAMAARKWQGNPYQPDAKK